jgi:hypothetical protein
MKYQACRMRRPALGGGKAGVLPVGATPQFLEAAMPRVRALYRRRNPEVKITLVEDGASPLVRGVEQRVGNMNGSGGGPPRPPWAAAASRFTLT